jgi:ABC-type multidrug transport system ATPase subunit
MDTPLIVAENVVKLFAGGAKPAIAGVSVRVGARRVTGVVGPDGSGKTTLLRLFAGLLVPGDGALTVCGRDTRTEVALLRDAVSYMPQRFGLYEDLSVRENLDLYADLRGVVGRERADAYQRLLDFTGLGPFTSRPAGKLSGGMKQKLGLACALVRTPRLLLLDEPSVGVDPISRRELWKMVYQLVDQGLGVVWSTAYLDEAERCSAVIALSEGCVLFQGRPQDLTAHVEGQTFLVRGATAKRSALARALKRTDVIDGVIQGSCVRVVMRPGSHRPDATELGGGGCAVEPTPPRFEDAFVAALGGSPKEESPLAGRTAECAGTGAAVVEADHLTKRFGTFTAADRVSFRIPRGEIFGLLGPNGAGKSTTFKMICGLLRPSSGSARVAGLDLYRVGAAARARFGYMAQKFSLCGDLSVRQNLRFFGGVYGLSGARLRDAVSRLSQALDLGEYLDDTSGSLPLGIKQKLSLACAVLHDPAVLFLDEPTSGVDPISRRRFWSHINAMVDGGVTVLVTTHFLDEAEYCDRVGLIYRGKVIAEGAPDELKQRAKTGACPEPTLEDAFITLVEESDRDGATP